MQKELTPLSISLFCSRCVWHLVLKNGIRDFININRAHILFFNVQFCYLSGENIRLGILCNNEFAESLARSADQYFKFFFRQNPHFPAKKIELPLDGVFLPFPNNTVQYGLHVIIENHQPSLLSESLSDIMISSLGSNEIDDETIITLAFYLHLGLQRMPQFDIQNQLAEYRSLTLIEGTPITQEFLEEKYKIAKSMLNDIYDEVFNLDGNEHNISVHWILEWLKMCNKQEHRHRNKMINLIDKHLGINDNMKLILYYFLNNMLTEKLSNERAAV